MSNETILIVDDEESVRKSLADVMRDEGYDVVTAASGREGIDLLSKSQPSLALLDIAMPEMDGIETLRRFKELQPDMQVIMVTGHGTIEIAVKTTKMGAYDFLIKPPELAKLTLVVKHGLEEYRLREENQSLKRSIEQRYEIVGESKQIKTLKQQIALAGPTNGWVLIHGESGTGKELVARAIHGASKRANGPFVEVNCAAIPRELIESELFGHEKGSFTGATGMKRGKFELADSGTIFLDEIADMSLATQAKVLRVLEGQEFQRVGGTKTLRADMRVIAASNKTLADEIKNNTFREDLYYRLNVLPIEVPPLRERPDDIPRLVHYFLKEFSGEYGQKLKAIDDDALTLFVRYQWPGNVRELRNIIERLIIMVPGPLLRAQDVPPPISSAPIGQKATGREAIMGYHGKASTLKDARAEFEREFITQKLKENGGNVSRTSDAIGVERSNLHRKIKTLGIELEDD
ncbi:MAG TPA: sigma-54 dependent transcriptional regulator [Nitrospirota bacterium]|nr:sigma-54 dependent transcriptional regulator [Nitrospirota bacterium]